MHFKIFDYDPYLEPYTQDFELRYARFEKKRKELLTRGESLSEFANGSEYFGFHKTEKGWYYREWAPGADKLYLTGEFNQWKRHKNRAKKLKNGVFELFIPGKDSLQDGMKVMTVLEHGGQELERIPLYAHRVLQNPEDNSWDAVIYDPASPYSWTDAGFQPKKNLFIYECHIGMAQEEGKVGSYQEFTENVLPRVKALGYNTIQIMAIMEHPYYGSFGYQVSNFFAASSRFGRPEALKDLVNQAHKMGIAVLLDVVHSHAATNTREGINQFDGTTYQFFHDGPRGDHPAWNTKCFNYDKNEVIHFLLSNLKYWLTEYHFDGFRFDGVTSMLYRDHGLGTAFTDYSRYFSLNTDVEAVTYLQLAAELTKEINPHAILIAEDMSAMPGLCLPVREGGIGFDYRLAMGEPDMWIKLLKEVSDDNWDLNHIYYELVSRRPMEPVIGYCESHDQALVGDKTIMFRLCDADMYWNMACDRQSMVIDRGMALHKLLRLLTMTLGGQGYLTFMGNEFGHPEWIDFPREGNGWSYHYCRRQWSLADDPSLRYHFLRDFDRDMVAMGKKYRILGQSDYQLYVHQDDKVLAYRKGKALFVYNLHPTKSFEGYFIPTLNPGQYEVVLSTDDPAYGGQGRICHQTYCTQTLPDGREGICLYLPSRTAAVLHEN